MPDYHILLGKSSFSVLDYKPAKEDKVSVQDGSSSLNKKLFYKTENFSSVILVLFYSHSSFIRCISSSDSD